MYHGIVTYNLLTYSMRLGNFAKWILNNYLVRE
jgi:hypothetical protein